MTKTDWTKEEVRAVAKDVVESISCVDPLFKARDMLTAYANRIEADERAVPYGHEFYDASGIYHFIRGSLPGYAQTKIVPLFTHPPAQPAQPAQCEMCNKLRRQIDGGDRLASFATGKGISPYINNDLLVAIKSRDNGFLNDTQWQTIRAELLAMDAEIRTLRATISKCAAAAGEIVMPSCSVEFLKQVPDEIDDVCREYESKIAASESELTETLKDARRYRWLRDRVGVDHTFGKHGAFIPCGNTKLNHEFTDGAIDDALDAMHNSAREVG